MRKLCVLVLGFVALPILADSKPEWQKTTSAKGRFEIQFPGKPGDNSKDITTQFILEAEGGKAALLATSTALPAPIDITNKDTATKMFDNGKDGLVKGFKNSKVLAERKLVHAGKYPAKEVDLDIPGLGLYRTKWIITETAFIQIVVLGPPEYVEGAIASVFFESVKILDAAKK